MELKVGGKCRNEESARLLYSRRFRLGLFSLFGLLSINSQLAKTWTLYFTDFSCQVKKISKLLSQSIKDQDKNIFKQKLMN